MDGVSGSTWRKLRGWGLAACLLAALPALAQVAGPDLWTRRDLPPGHKPPPEVLRTIAVEINTGLLRSDARLSLPLHDGSRLPVTRSALVPTPKGFIWRGTVDRQGMGNATFSVVNGAVAGSILTGKGQSLRLRRAPSGVHLLEEIDLSKLPREGKSASVSGQQGDGSNDPALDSCSTDSPGEIDLLVVYTPAARIAAGTLDDIEADIYLAVDLANQTYVYSDVQQRLRLVHMEEVPYTESTPASSANDQTALKNGTGVLSSVHALRNAKGADLVAMITGKGDECGKSDTMDPVGNAFESSAFSVVRRDCMSAAGQYSLAHELGHPMGARHDWDEDGNVTAYPFGHGHIADAMPPPWRTVMAYNTKCKAAGPDCPRILNWSNPSVSVDMLSTGADTGEEPADNHRVLNKTALTVANFRCKIGGPSTRTDVWMKDTWSDSGSEPDPAQAGRPMWESPYIWVRTTQDAGFNQQHKHQNPVAGQENFIYVKVHNGGAATSGNLDIRVANANVGLAWPGSWTTLPSAPVPVSLAARSTKIVELPWTPTSAGHFCLVARWVSSGTDSMTTPEGSDIEVNVRGNNNIVWRNLHLIDLGATDANADAAFQVEGPASGAPFVLEIRPVPSQRPGGPRLPRFVDFGRIMMTLDDRLMDAWKRASFQSKGLRRDGSTLIVVDPGGAQLTLAPMKGSGQARLLFSRPKSGKYPRAEFGWRVFQTSTEKGHTGVGGGLTYQVRTFAGQGIAAR